MADLIFNNIADCSNITLSTPNPDLITRMSTGVYLDKPNVQSYDITWSNNCCEDNIVKVAPLYEFDSDIVDCTTFVVLGVTFAQYEINLFNINGNFISSITAEPTNLPNSSPSILTFTVQNDNSTNFLLPTLASATSINYKIIVTTNAGFAYTLNYILTQIPGTPCVGYTLIGDTPFIEYPDVPSNVVYPTSSTLDFNELIESTPVLTGVYQVSICEVGEDESAICVQNHAFINCGDLKCFVVRKFAECVDSDVMNYYEALTYANDCSDNISYDEVCAIYEVLNIKLATDGCYAQEDDCNCTGARVKSNKYLTPVKRSSTIKKGCGCG